ncbi:calcium-transporting ATPase, partial [Haematococcus lacustris]
MGALALATEEPTPELLRLRPYGREEPLIMGRMWKHIVVQGLYQLAWMFVCLYGLPEIIPRYYIGERYKPKYYGEQCLERTGDARICNWVLNCGFPVGAETANTAACSLYTERWMPQGLPLPIDAATAVCGAGVPTCPDLTKLVAVQADLQRGLNDDWYRQRHTSLSVLFNAFICMQVANEVASRRLLTNPVFMAVIVITMGLQAIIINFLGSFFK